MTRYLITFVFVAILVLVLWAILRFSVISSIRTKGAKKRLRYPDSGGVARICGFAPPSELVEFYQRAPFVDLVEFSLVDRSKAPPKEWFIGGFNPLTPTDVLEQRRITGIKDGIPIADDMAKGTYVVVPNGAVMLRSPNVAGGEVEVARSITDFVNFEVRQNG